MVTEEIQINRARRKNKRPAKISGLLKKLASSSVLVSDLAGPSVDDEEGTDVEIVLEEVVCGVPVVEEDDCEDAVVVLAEDIVVDCCVVVED